MTEGMPLFASNHVTMPFTRDRQRAVDSLVRDYLWSQTLPPVPPLPGKSDRSGYAEYLLTGHYPLNADIAERCVP